MRTPRPTPTIDPAPPPPGRDRAGASQPAWPCRTQRPERPPVLSMDVFLAGGIFLVAYALDRVGALDRTLVALLGGLLLVVLGVIDQEAAFAAIDFNVIFLLAGMMVLASALRGPASSSGWRSARSACRAGTRCGCSSSCASSRRGLSAFLDNVTTVLLMTPVTLSVARRLRHLAVAVPHQPDPGVQHRRHRDPHRRPAEHPHRLGGRARLRRLPREPGPGRARHHRRLRW